MNEPTIIELSLPPETYGALEQAAQRAHKTAKEIAVAAIESYLKQLATIDPLLGLFADEPDLIQQVIEDALNTRGTTPLRLAETPYG